MAKVLTACDAQTIQVLASSLPLANRRRQWEVL